uniref:Bactericidal permeability-increasing protein n=1 Tax=Tetraodon nigroviridis TaxID=99883 RepID=H3D380_TETNG
MRQFLAVLLLVTSSSGESPALQVALSSKALQYGASAGPQWVTEKLKNISLPDISGEMFILVDTLYYTLTGITIENLEIPEPSVEFYPESTGLKTSVSGLGVALRGGWMTTYACYRHDGGSFQIAVVDVAVTSVVRLGREVDGHPLVTSVSCEAHVGDVHMNFEGGARNSWIFQPFVHQLAGRLRGEMEEKICPSLEDSIAKFDYHLLAINISIDVNKDLTLDLSLTDEPVVDVSSLNVGLKGAIYSSKTHAEPPFEPQDFTMAEQPDFMLSLGVSEYTLNSALYAYYSAGLLQVFINESMVPSYSPVHLNTSSVGAFIPQLPEMYPDLLMDLQVYAREVPLVSFQPGLLQLDLQGAVKAFAVQRNGTQIPLFTLNTDSKFSGKVWISGGRVKGSVELNNLTLTLEATEIGQFETGKLEKFAGIGARLAMSKLNRLLGEGVDLPRLKQAELVNTTLEVEKGFVTILTDAQISLPDGMFN